MSESEPASTTGVVAANGAGAGSVLLAADAGRLRDAGDCLAAEPGREERAPGEDGRLPTCIACPDNTTEFEGPDSCASVAELAYTPEREQPGPGLGGRDVRSAGLTGWRSIRAGG